MQPRRASRTGSTRASDNYDPLGAVKGTFTSVILGIVIWPLLIFVIARTVF